MHIHLPMNYVHVLVYAFYFRESQSMSNKNDEQESKDLSTRRWGPQVGEVTRLSI